MVEILSLLFHFLPFPKPCTKNQERDPHLVTEGFLRRQKAERNISLPCIQKARAQEELFRPRWSASQRLQYARGWQTAWCLDSKHSHPLSKQRRSCHRGKQHRRPAARAPAGLVPNKTAFVPCFGVNRPSSLRKKRKKKKKARSFLSALELDPKKY